MSYTISSGCRSYCPNIYKTRLCSPSSSHHAVYLRCCIISVYEQSRHHRIRGIRSWLLEGARPPYCFCDHLTKLDLRRLWLAEEAEEARDLLALRMVVADVAITSAGCAVDDFRLCALETSAAPDLIQGRLGATGWVLIDIEPAFASLVPVAIAPDVLHRRRAQIAHRKRQAIARLRRTTFEWVHPLAHDYWRDDIPVQGRVSI